jgi:hypothetical protein
VGAESCSGEETLRADVAKRVGYDPFFPSAKQLIVANLATDPAGGFVARIQLIDERGVAYGTRVFHADRDCADLVDTVALAIAIAIDPRSLAPRPATAPAPAQAAPPAPAPEPREPPREPPANSLPAPPGVPVTFDGVVGLVASAGVAPTLAMGGAIGAVVRWRRVSLEIDGRVDAPASVPAQGGGRVSTWLASLTVAPCAHAGVLVACALAQGGAMRASGDETGGTDTWVNWWAAGARFGVTTPLSERIAFRLRSDLVANLEPQRLDLNRIRAWTAPPMAESLGADLVGHFR